MGSQLGKESESSRGQTVRSKVNKQNTSRLSDNNSESEDHLRRRSSIDSDISSPVYISSALTKPIGSGIVGQSSVSNWRTSSGSQSNQHKASLPAEIIVVSEGSDERDKEERLVLPVLFKPLIPIGHETLASHYPQINPQLVINLSSTVQEELRLKADLIAKEQYKLIDKVKETDVCVSQVTSFFVNERQSRSLKLTDNFAKIEEISVLIEKCEKDLHKCIRSLDTLNRYLPSGNRLEKLDFRSSGQEQVTLKSK